MGAGEASRPSARRVRVDANAPQPATTAAATANLLVDALGSPGRPAGRRAVATPAGVLRTHAAACRHAGTAVIAVVTVADRRRAAPAAAAIHLNPRSWPKVDDVSLEQHGPPAAATTTASSDFGVARARGATLAAAAMGLEDSAEPQAAERRYLEGTTSCPADAARLRALPRAAPAARTTTPQRRELGHAAESRRGATRPARSVLVRASATRRPRGAEATTSSATTAVLIALLVGAAQAPESGAARRRRTAWARGRGGGVCAHAAVDGGVTVDGEDEGTISNHREQASGGDRERRHRENDGAAVFGARGGPPRATPLGRGRGGSGGVEGHRARERDGSRVDGPRDVKAGVEVAGRVGE